MTICIAWKTDETAFIVADSAVTKKSEIDNVSTVTSFGEAQGNIGSGGDHVYEGAFKIYSDDNVSICLSGDAAFGNEVVRILLLHLSFNRSVEESIENTINNFQDFNAKPGIQIVVASYSEGAKLHTIENKAKSIVCSDKDFVIFGSPSNDLKQYVESFYKAFKDSWISEIKISPKANEYFHIRMLVLAQIYGIHNYTLEDGIGGAYTGMSVNSSGVQLQPDICYVITGENVTFDLMMFTSVHVEKNHFCIINTNTSNILIPNMSVSPKSQDDFLDSSISKATKKFDSGEFKYYIFLNLARHSAVIVDMGENLHHLLLSVDVRGSDTRTIGLLVDKDLQDAINANYEPITTLKDAQIRLFPYMPAPKEKIELISKEISDIRASKFYTSNLDTHKFLIFKGGNVTNWFYGRRETIFPFLKHFKESEYIQVVNMSNDFTELEFKNGEVIYPTLPDTVSEVFSKIIDKKRADDLYIFEFTTGDWEPHTVNILSSDLEEAKKEAIKEVEDNFDDYYNFMFVGKRFYHPAYFFD